MRGQKARSVARWCVPGRTGRVILMQPGTPGGLACFPVAVFLSPGAMHLKSHRVPPNASFQGESSTSTSTARQGGLSTSTMKPNPRLSFAFLVFRARARTRARTRKADWGHTTLAEQRCVDPDGFGDLREFEVFAGCCFSETPAVREQLRCPR